MPPFCLPFISCLVASCENVSFQDCSWCQACSSVMGSSPAGLCLTQLSSDGDSSLTGKGRAGSAKGQEKPPCLGVSACISQHFTCRIHRINCFVGEAMGYRGLRQHYFYKAIASSTPLSKFRHLLCACGEEQLCLSPWSAVKAAPGSCAVLTSSPQTCSLTTHLTFRHSLTPG